MSPTSPPALTALVVDDEAPARNEVAWLLDQDERVERVLTAASGTAALAALEREQIDVVFSDISEALEAIDSHPLVDDLANEDSLDVLLADHGNLPSELAGREIIHP